MSNISGEGTLTGEIFGATDVIDYNNLTNKPKINSQEVEGTHNGRYYGLTESEIIDWIDYEALPEATKKNGKIYYIRDVGTYEEKTITNVAIASFNDGSPNPLKTLKTDINHTQDLHGYEKPWSGGAGKNKLPSSNATNTTLNGITFKTSGDGIYEVFGTATVRTNCEFTFSQATSLESGKKLSFFNNFTGYNLFFRQGGADKTYYNFSSENRTVTIAAADAVEFDTLRITVESGTTINGKFALMMYEGDTTSTYEPYANICPISGKSSLVVTVVDDITLPTTEETYEITLGQTVYGGKLNATTGELTVTDGYIASYNGETLTSTWISDRDEYIPNTTPTIGAEVVYKLATPTSTTITPTEIRSLLGDNNIWTDSGNIIELIYFSPTGETENQIRTNDEIFGRA